MQRSDNAKPSTASAPVRLLAAVAGLLLILVVCATASIAAPVAPVLDCAAPPPLRPVAFDNSRLRQGRFTYRLTMHNKPLGDFVIEIRRQPDGRWRFTADGVGFDQHWEAVAGRDMTPVRASLEMKPKGRPYRLTVAYAGGAATGTEHKDGVDHPIRDTIRGHTVDQRIDWAAMMALGLPPGQRAAFEVYDPATGSSRLLAAASTAPDMAGPEGRRAMVRLNYRICKAGEAPEDYTVFATRAEPRVMLREDMRGEIVSTLIRIEP
jgi:hypothetical protein